MNMISRGEIQAFVNDVVRQFRPSVVILFGSYAYGTPTKDSDVDLLIVMPHRGSSAEAATRIRLACPRAFPMDLIVRTPGEIRRRVRIGDRFVEEITSKGIKLHETHDPRMGR
jgi:predicted nucleotidyltransferase